MNSSISTSSSTSSSSSTSFPLNLTLLIQTPYQVQPLRFHATAQVNDLNPNHEFMNKLSTIPTPTSTTTNSSLYSIQSITPFQTVEDLLLAIQQHITTPSFSISTSSTLISSHVQLIFGGRILNDPLEPLSQVFNKTLQAHCSTVSSTLKSHDQPTLPNPSSSLLSSFPIGSNSLTNFSSSSSKSTILTLHLLSKSAPITFQPQTEFETSDFNSNFQPAELLSESQLFFSSSSTFTDCPNTSYVTMPASDSNTFPETTSTSLSPSSSPSNITPIHDSSSPTMTTTPSTSTFTPSPSTSTSPFNPPIPTITSTSVTNPLLSSPENSLPPHLLHYHQYYTEYYQSYYQSHLQSFSKYFSTVYSPTASTGATLSSASIMTSLPSLPSSSYTLLTSSSPSPPELSTPLPPPPPLSQQQPQNPNPLPDPLPQPHAAPPLPPAPPTPVRIRLSLRSLLSLAFKWSLVLYLFTRHLSWTKSIILCIFALVSFGFQAGWWFHRRPSFLPSLNVPSVIQSLIPGTHPLDPATNAREHLQAAAARLDNNNGRNEMVEFEQ